MHPVTNLSEVSPVKGHALFPEVLEERRKDLVFDVLGFDSISGTALLDDLENDLLHLFIRRQELSDENQHHLSCVVVSVVSVHQRNQVTNRLELINT